MGIKSTELMLSYKGTGGYYRSQHPLPKLKKNVNDTTVMCDHELISYYYIEMSYLRELNGPDIRSRCHK
jgi:hypothetical protein